MTTYAIEGQGATIAFGVSSVPNDIISIVLPEKTREVLETTHLGTTTAKTFKPAKLKTVGDIAVEIDHNPEEADLLLGDVETITISYPLLSGQTTPTKLQFSGFVTQQGGQEFRTDTKMSTKLSIKVSGDITVIPAT